MGRRSRKRAGSPSEDPGAPASRPPAPAARRTSRRRERPPAPWGSFPLVELCVLLALILAVAGLITWPGGRVLLLVALALGSLAGLELSIREHLAGYRSHTTLLAGTVAVAVTAALFFSRVPREVMLVAAATAFATAFFALRELFKRRSGGLGFR